jgi:hypothetical protein
MIIKMVKLKVSFDKRWDETNENERMICECKSRGKTGSGKNGSFLSYMFHNRYMRGVSLK